MSVKIYDNFLNNEDFLKIYELMTSNNFPWYLNEHVVHKKERENFKELKNFQFVHMFYNNFSIQSVYFTNISSIISQMEVSALIKIKSNLKTRWNTIEEFSPHVDNFLNNSRTAIFYINSNNGYTRFVESNQKVESVSNRLITFPTKMLHTGTTHTDSKYRIVININYFGEI